MTSDTSKFLESSLIGLKKRDDAPIPIVLWLYWLNRGLTSSITIGDWEESLVARQEKILLLDGNGF